MAATLGVGPCVAQVQAVAVLKVLTAMFRTCGVNVEKQVADFFTAFDKVEHGNLSSVVVEELSRIQKVAQPLRFKPSSIQEAVEHARHNQEKGLLQVMAMPFGRNPMLEITKQLMATSGDRRAKQELARVRDLLRGPPLQIQIVWM